MKSYAFMAMPVAVLLAAAPAIADDADAHWRVFVADQADGTVTAIDLDAPEERWQFDVAGPARLYPTASGRVVVAVQSDDDRVDVFSSGISLTSHEDHADIAIADPEKIDGTVEGPRPFHVVTHQKTTAINFDNGGYALLLDEADLLDGELDGRRFEQDTAHHGFAIPIKDYVISSVAAEPDPEAEGLPARIGLGAFSPEGEALSAMQTCTDLHGEAFSGRFLVAGCAEGIAVVDTSGTAPETGLLPYPDDLPEASTGTVLGAKSMQVFLGNYGADGLLVIDPEGEPHFRHVALSFRMVDFVLDPARAQFAYVLTEDGALHRLNLLSGAIEASGAVTKPYSMDGHWRDPRPRLAIAGDEILITDPLEALLRVIDSDTLEQTRTIAVEGMPYNLAVVGGSGLTH